MLLATIDHFSSTFYVPLSTFDLLILLSLLPCYFVLLAGGAGGGSFPFSFEPGAGSGQPDAVVWCLEACMALALESQAEPWVACAALESQTEPVVHLVQGRR